MANIKKKNRTMTNVGINVGKGENILLVTI